MEVFVYMPEADHGRRFQRMSLSALIAAEPVAAQLGQVLIEALERDAIVEIPATRVARARVTRASWAPCEPPAAKLRALTGQPISIRLQGLGETPGKPASELEIGDVVSWNNAPLAARIVAIPRRSEHSVWVVERYDDGREFRRRFLLSRVVPAETPGGNPDRQHIERLEPRRVAA